ncbi:hypothetical protein VHEMI05586 [[Torrubiella] hemipterigena]|uniref:Uncharacterized protein n=1 Tax=[Torrubiella] hemipterigena TaxID=1531966 RepID=A0A0A1SYD9_9HYPO|nr:hypothetical protein VHEMI05586 [[Torrubiella] hemipterigena]
MFRQQLKSAWARRPQTSIGRRLPVSLFRAESTQSSQASRIDRITARLPRPLRKYTTGLRNAPLSHVVSFLILHELTAILPLFGLFALFHYTSIAPIEYMTQHFGEYVQSGVSRFEKYFKKKEWFGFTKEDSTISKQETGNTTGAQTDDVLQKIATGDAKYTVLMEVALAYAITKALLPIRIIGSVWATPWFAKGLLRAKALITRKK